MGLDGKAVLDSHFFLESFNFLVLKFHNLLAAGADEVIVVTFVRDIVVLRLRAEVPGLCEAGIAEEIERSEDCRESEMRIGLCQLMIHRLCSDVFLPEEGVQDQFTLAGELELMLAQVFHQGLHFLDVLLCHAAPPMGLIKDETAQLVKGCRAWGQRRDKLTEISGAGYSATL